MLKRLFRWLIRSVVIVVILLIIAAIADYVNHRVKPGSVLVVTLDGPVVERGRTGISGLFNGGKETPLNQVREALDKAGRDARIVGVALKIIDPDMEFAQAQELAALVHDFAGHGKWTSSYIETAGEEGPGNLPYVVATAAHEVAMMPQGELNLFGVGVREIFARGAFDLLGVRPDFMAAGKYKSAMNIFTEKDFTPGQREEDEGAGLRPLRPARQPNRGPTPSWRRNRTRDYRPRARLPPTPVSRQISWTGWNMRTTSKITSSTTAAAPSTPPSTTKTTCARGSCRRCGTTTKSR